MKSSKTHELAKPIVEAIRKGLPNSILLKINDVEILIGITTAKNIELRVWDPVAERYSSDKVSAWYAARALTIAKCALATATMEGL